MAAYFWVGGSGTWNTSTTTNWATLSGGAGGAGVPTSADTVTFDNLSGTGTVTISGAVCSTFTMTAVASTMTFAFGSSSITCSGSGTVWSAVGTGISYTGSPTVNISNNSATATTVTNNVGWTEANAFDFNISTGTYALTLTGTGCTMRSLNFTGFTGTFNPGSNGYTFYGSLTLVAGMTSVNPGAGSGYIFSNTSGTAVLISAGKSLYSVTRNGAGGTLSLGDALSVSSIGTPAGLVVTAGTFDANNQNITVSGTVSVANSAGAIVNMGSGTWTLVSSSTSGNCWVAGTSSVINSNTSTIAISSTSTAQKNFYTGGKTYNNLSITGATGIATYLITGGGTFNTVSSSKTVPYTISIDANISVSTWSAQSSIGRLFTLSSATAGTVVGLAVTNSFTLDYSVVNDITLSTTNGTVTNGGLNPRTTGWTLGSGSTYYEAFTSSLGTWTVPSSFNSSINAIHLIGGGGGGAGGIGSTVAGGAGGGGGGYSQLANQSYSAGQQVVYSVGAGGTGNVGNTISSIGGTGGTTSWNGVQNTISYVSSAASVQNTSSTTITVTVPTVSDGQLMVMLLQSSNAAPSWVTPAGWTLGATGQNGRIPFWRIASSEPASYTVTQGLAGTADATIIVFANAQWDTAGLVNQTASATITPPAITIATPNSAIIYQASQISTSQTYSTPTGYTAATSDSDSTTPSSAVFYLLGVASGSYTAPSTTASTSTTRAYIISLAPTVASYTASATGGSGGIANSTPISAGGIGGTGSGGIINYTGGTGGNGAVTGTSARMAGGGGGSAGPNGNGGAGGNGGGGGTSSSGGGGGNGGGSAGANGSSVNSIGGAGGNSSAGIGSGAGATASANGTTGNVGGGGGGGSTSGFPPGGGGFGIDIISGLSSGGGGGGGQSNGNNIVGTGGLYGGGGGGGGTTTLGRSGASGAQGLIVVTWTLASPIITSMRLTNTGNLLVNSGTSMIFDETTQSNIRLSPTAFYSSQLDEVTNPGVAMRYYANNTVQISGIFDETSTLN